MEHDWKTFSLKALENDTECHSQYSKCEIVSNFVDHWWDQCHSFTFDSDIQNWEAQKNPRIVLWEMKFLQFQMRNWPNWFRKSICRAFHTSKSVRVLRCAQYSGFRRSQLHGAWVVVVAHVGTWKFDHVFWIWIRESALVSL